MLQDGDVDPMGQETFPGPVLWPEPQLRVLKEPWLQGLGLATFARVGFWGPLMLG